MSIHGYDQVIYLLQGGGALGSYQVGVCKALLEFGCTPDWVVGTSVGAINAAIIAGNKPEHRIAKLNEFWDTIASPLPTLPDSINKYLLTLGDKYSFKEWQNFYGAQWSVLFGQPGFFKPRCFSPWLEFSSTPDKLSYYDTTELRNTLEKVIDFDLINKMKIRLSLVAVHVKTGAAVRFDNTRQIIGPEHIMASCALPPGFPAIKIDNEYYWDGGLISNTPFSIVLEEKTPSKLLCFIVNLYSFPNRLPTSMLDVISTTKDLAYASRHQQILHYFCELHYLQHTISSLAKTIVNNKDLEDALKVIASVGHPTSLKIIRFRYKDCPSDLWSKDFNFTPQVLKDHHYAGYRDAQKALNKSTWHDLIALDDSAPIVNEF